jgi:nucleoid-associated protein YgaU
MSSAYRGVLGGSPKAIDLFRAGEFDKGADELLNHSEYKASKEGRPIKGKLLPGIAPRMEEESNFIRGEAQRRAKLGSPVTQSAAPTPVAQEKPKQEQAPAPVDSDYTVQSGDTLWKLTKGDPNRIKQIQAANPNLDPNKLSVGQKIKMPR